VEKCEVGDVTAYKFLMRGAVGRFSDFPWPQPRGGAPADWVEAGGPLTDCLYGVHASSRAHLLDWIDDELWEVELGGEVVERNSMLVAERGRLTRRVETWNDETATAFGEACAWRSRDLALLELRRLELTAEATQLLDSLTLPDLQAAAVASVGERPPAETEAAAFAADAVSLAGGRRPDAWRDQSTAASGISQSPGATAANLAFVVAHAAGRAAIATEGDTAYAAAFEAERAWQLAWLAERLGLTSA
jgi:hypothetical protein